MKLNFFKKAFGFGVSLIFIFFIFRQIDVKESLHLMKQVNFGIMFLAIPVYFLAFILRSARWRIILLNEDIKGLYSLISSIFIGYMANSLLPARMGEVYRAHVFGKKENVPRVKVFASIVLERIFDGLVLFVMLLSLILLFYSKPWLIKLALAVGFLFIGSLSLLFTFKSLYNKDFWLKNKLNKIKNTLTSFKFTNSLLNKFDKVLNSFTEGLDIFHSPVSLAKTLFLTILIWLIEGLTMFLMIKSFGLSIGFLSSIFVLAISSFSTMIPAGPASIGPYQYGYITALSIFNVSQETALAVSLVNQLFAISFVCLAGFLFVLYDHINLNQIEKEIEIFSD